MIMTCEEILKELKAHGSKQSKKIFMRHGAREPFYGVKIQDLKKIVKKVKENHALSLELFETGNSDAMVLAGYITQPQKMTKPILHKWAKEAYWYMLSEYTVAQTAAESPHGFHLAQKWIESKKENIASCGWSTLSHLALIKADEALDLDYYRAQLKRIVREIDISLNRVKYTMNQFLICVGVAVKALHREALQAAKAVGSVDVAMGETSCKTPRADEYILKAIEKGRLGKKKKRAIC